ncbi:MAG: class I SAM-dependent methyltransferase [Thermoanaerobaculia bacterium]
MRDLGDDPVSGCASMFDRLVAISEEASVAAYSLSTPELLDEATDEIVALFRNWNLLDPSSRVLEIGCGVGRIGHALGGVVGSFHGVEISRGMLVRAVRRCSEAPRISFSLSSGRDLSHLKSGAFDLVLAVDAFPYIHAAGERVVRRHFEEIVRVTRGRGAFALINYSYRGELDRDREDLRALARAHGLELVVDGAAPFTVWDGVAFCLRKIEEPARRESLRRAGS